MYQSLFMELGKTNYGEKFNIFVEKNIAVIEEQYEIYSEWFKENNPTGTIRMKNFLSLRNSINNFQNNNTITPEELDERIQAFEKILDQYEEEATIIKQFEDKLDLYMEEDISINNAFIKEKDIPKELPGKLRFGIRNFIEK